MPKPRLEDLCAGEPRMPAELELWRETVREEALGGEGLGWDMALFWRLTGSDGVDVYAVTLQEDGATWRHEHGPFATAEAALAYLSARGEIHGLDWPPYTARS